jgi:hypothetical protein
LATLTIVDHLELADEVETDFAEFILEQLEEEGQEVLDGSLVAKERGKSRDLHSESGSNMLARVGVEVLDAGEDAGKDDFSVDQLGEACA